MPKIEEKVALLADLDSTDTFCMLKHQDKMERVASDYIIIPLGDKNDPVIDVVDELVIPLCSECINGFQDQDWLLIFCIKCMASQWVYKPIAKLDYRNKIMDYSYNGIVLNGCPECGNEFNGIWYM